MLGRCESRSGRDTTHEVARYADVGDRARYAHARGAVQGDRTEGVRPADVAVRWAALPMLERDGKVLNKIQIALLALDTRGRVAYSKNAVAELAVPVDQSIRLQASGVRWVTKFDVEPGRYHLRLAACETMTGRTDRCLCDVDVPDFEREKRSISGLLLTSTRCRTGVTHGWQEVNTWALPAPTTATRVFLQNDVLFAALELYDGKRRRATRRSPWRFGLRTVPRCGGSPSRSGRRTSGPIATCRIWTLPLERSRPVNTHCTSRRDAKVRRTHR